MTNNRNHSSNNKHGKIIRRGLSDVFDQNVSLTEDMAKMGLESSTQPSSTWSSKSGGWPNWSLLRLKDGPPINFAITMEQRIDDYSIMAAPQASKASFDDATEHIMEIRDLVGQAKGSLEDELNNIIANDMSFVVFDSNHIENVGCDFEKTMRLCKEIFKEEREDLEKLLPWSNEYQQRLENVINKGPNDKAHGRREVVNHAAALVYITNAVVKRDEAFTEDLIKETHRILCNGVDAQVHGKPFDSQKYAGIYRTVPVMAGSTGFVPPK